MALKLPLGLTFPKKVIIPNPRINLCYHVVWFLVFVFFVLRFLISQQWLKKFDIANDMFAHTWVTGGDSADELEAGWNKFSATGFCLYPSLHDYWWDTRESSKFTNYVCKKPCYNQAYATDCVPAWDLYKSTREHTFLVTSIRSTEFTTSGTSYQNYLLSSAEHLQIGLSYGFDVVTPGGFWYVLGLTKSRGSKEDMQKARSRSPGTDAHGIKTQILKSDGSLSEKLGDGSITLPVKKLFELAGKPNLLDGTRPEVGPNQMTGSAGEAPTTRRVGVDVIITIECGDTENNFWPASWSSEYTCYLSVRTGETPLVEYEHVDNTGYEHGRPLRARKMYGIRVIVERRGHFKIFDSNNFVLQLVALLVLLSIPKNVVLIFMTTCLGRLSIIYQRFIYEDFPVRGTVAGMITRLISSGNTFHKLVEFESKYKHQDDGEDDVKGISDAQMKDRIREIVGPRHPNHSEEEIEQMVDFCFYMVFKAQHENARQPSSTRIGTITLDGFTGATASNEKMTLDDLLALFDWKRSRGILETLFTPSELKKDVLQKAIDETGFKSNAHEKAIGKSAHDDPERAKSGLRDEADPKYAGLPREIASAHKKLDKQMSDVEGNLTDVQTQLLLLKEQMNDWQKKQSDTFEEESDSGDSAGGPSLHEVNKLSETVREMNERMSDRGSEVDSTETTRQLQKELQVMQAQHAIKYHCFMERLESLEHIADKLSKRHARSSERGSNYSKEDSSRETFSAREKTEESGTLVEESSKLE